MSTQPMSRPRIKKHGLPYYAKFTPWKKRAARGHERAAQKRDWQREHKRDDA